jgi:hypothetical protein
MGNEVRFDDSDILLMQWLGIMVAIAIITLIVSWRLSRKPPNRRISVPPSHGFKDDHGSTVSMRVVRPHEVPLFDDRDGAVHVLPSERAFDSYSASDECAATDDNSCDGTGGGSTLTISSNAGVRLTHSCTRSTMRGSESCWTKFASCVPLPPLR